MCLSIRIQNYQQGFSTIWRIYIGKRYQKDVIYFLQLSISFFILLHIKSLIQPSYWCCTALSPLKLHIWSRPVLYACLSCSPKEAVYWKGCRLKIDPSFGGGPLTEKRDNSHLALLPFLFDRLLGSFFECGDLKTNKKNRKEELFIYVGFIHVWIFPQNWFFDNANK